MSTDNKDNIEPKIEESTENIKNLKNEMGRKFANQEQMFQAMSQKLDAMATKYTEPSVAPETTEEDLYSDPDAYIQKRLDKRLKSFEQGLDQRQQQQAKQQQVVNEITAEFPEINQSGSDLQLKAQELYAGLSQDEKENPTAWKATIFEAAMAVGVKPRSQRSESTDDFTFGSGKGSSSSLNRSSRRTSEDLSDDTINFASLMGMDISDPEKLKALKERTKRKDWKYSGSKE